VLVPPSWVLATVGDVLRGVEAGKSEKTLERRPVEDDVGVVKVSAVTWGEFDPAESKAILPSQFDHSKSIRSGDLLFSRANTAELAGAVVHVKGDHPRLMLSDKILRLLPDDGIAPRYLMYSLRTADSRRHLEGSATGTSTSMRNITQENLRTTPLQLPPAPEQRRIVAKLDAIFEQTRAAKARLERLPALFEKLKRSILAAAFRGDLTKDWRAAHPDVEPASVLLDRIRAERRRRWEDGLRAKGKDLRKTNYTKPDPASSEGLDELPHGWTWATVEELSTKVADGVHKKPNYVEFGIPFVTVKNLTAGRGISFENVSYVTASDHDEFSRRTNPERDDLLVSKDGTLGVVRRVDTDVVFSIFVSVALVKPVLREMSEFIEHALQSPQVQAQMVGVGSGLQHIHLQDLRRDCLPVAPMAEQLVLVARLRELLLVVDALGARHKAAASRALTLEKAALAKAFRGELVPQDPADEPASVLLDRIRATRAADPERPWRGRGRRSNDTAVAEAAATDPNNGHATNGHHNESLDLVVGVFQIDRRLTTTAIAEATGLDAAVVKKALKILVDGGQVRVHGRARATTYEWSP
jgi:type I restriction enzyme S subunit